MANYLAGKLIQRREEENLRTDEENNHGRSEKFRNDPLEADHSSGREPPSSQVGYGGVNREKEVAHDQHVHDADASVQRHEEENMRTDEEKSHGRSEKFRNDPLEADHIAGREPPSSQVGYGGGNREKEFAHDQHVHDADASQQPHDHLGDDKTHGVRFEGGHGHSDPRLSEDQPMTTSSETHDMTHRNAEPSELGVESLRLGEGVREGGGPGDQSRSYGMTDGNAKPSESGLESADDGGPKHQSRRYGFADANSKPSESGFGNSGPGGYTEDGGSELNDEVGTGESHPGGEYVVQGDAQKIPITHKSKHYQDSNEHWGGLPAPTRPPGAVLLDENYFDGPRYYCEPTVDSKGAVNYTQQNKHSNQSSDRLQEGEVRGGVLHSVVSGHATGAGQDNYGASEVSRAPTSGPVGHQGIEPQEYHQTGSAPHPDGSAYSQQYTQPDARNTNASELEGSQQPSKPTPMEESGKAPTLTEESDHNQKGGLMAKIKSHLPGHHKHHVGTDSDKKHEAPPTTSAPEHEKPDFMEKIKDKLTPKHHQPNQSN